MPTRPPSHRALHARSPAQRNREYDRRRGSFRERGYDPRWDQARAAYLRKHPLCIMCARTGLQVAASVVDHIVPHRGDPQLFWDQANWQPLCRTHHSRTKQRIERGPAREDVRELFPIPCEHER